MKGRSKVIPVQWDICDQNSESAQYVAEKKTTVWIHNNKVGLLPQTTAVDEVTADSSFSQKTSTIATAVVCGTPVSHGRCYCEITFSEPLTETGITFGIIQGNPKKLVSYSVEGINLVGNTNNSWGLSHKGHLYHDGKCVKNNYCLGFFKAETVVGCLVDLINCSIHYFVNGIDAGVAFTSTEFLKGPLYFAVSSTGETTEVTIMCFSIYLCTLQEICISKIIEYLRNHRPTSTTQRKQFAVIDKLNIPVLMKHNIIKYL